MIWCLILGVLGDSLAPRFPSLVLYFPMYENAYICIWRYMREFGFLSGKTWRRCVSTTILLRCNWCLTSFKCCFAFTSCACVKTRRTPSPVYGSSDDCYHNFQHHWPKLTEWPSRFNWATYFQIVDDCHSTNNHYNKHYLLPMWVI